jgi:hypothetical protein
VDLDDMISRAKAEIAEAETQLRAAQAHLGELVTIRDRLREAEQRYAVAPSASARTTDGPAQPIAALPDLPAAGLSDAAQHDPAAERHDAGDDLRQDIPQTALIEDALTNFSRPATPLQIRDRLAEDGHDLTREQVRSALGYLLRKKRVARPKPGYWRLPRQTATRAPASAVGRETQPDQAMGSGPAAPATSFGPAASTTGPGEAGENGTSSQGGVLARAGLNSHPASY